MFGLDPYEVPDLETLMRVPLIELSPLALLRQLKLDAGVL